MEEMISEKKDLEEGSSSSSKPKRNQSSAYTINHARIKSRSSRTFRMLVTERRVTHVGQFDVAFRAGVHKQVAVRWVELGCSYDFGELLHVDWLDVHNVYIAGGMGGETQEYAGRTTY
jgi:hypothetical protein